MTPTLTAVFTPPTRWPDDPDRITIFLAGSIEMGRAERWQSKVIEALAAYPVTILNPRRDDWDSSWVQEASNPQFAEQVNWELDGIDCSDIVVFYFAPGTVSPISLLEFGLVTATIPSSIALCCPPGFARKGNVDIVAERHGIVNHEDWDAFIAAIVRRIEIRMGHNTL